MPRIISGTARGTHLATPKDRQTRPTSDRVKEALFSILTPHIPAHGFLDLYAGTGQVGLEAASRGCTSVIVVEQACECLDLIRANLKKTHLESMVRLVAGNVPTVVKNLLRSGNRFDLIFLDPPYKLAGQVMAQLSPYLSDLLNDDGLVILEHESAGQAVSFVTNLQLVRDCQYGTAMLSFYHKDPSARNSPDGPA